MRSACDQDDILARPREVRAQESADRPGTEYGDGHLPFRAAATDRRWILPVAVRGIWSTMKSRRGTL